MRKVSELLVAECFIGICLGFNIFNLIAQVFAISTIVYFECLWVIFTSDKIDLIPIIKPIFIGFAIAILFIFSLICDIISGIFNFR